MEQIKTEHNYWANIKNELKNLLSEDIFNMWISPLQCVEEGDETWILSAPNEFAAIWLKDNYLDLISKHAEILTQKPILIVVESNDSSHENPNNRVQSSRDRSVSDKLEIAGANKRGLKSHIKTKIPLLNHKNTFENFIVGSSNQLAHAACVAVADSLAKDYNPLFLYGDTGLGKTHLMHAIAHQVLNINEDAQVVYVSCEKFTNEFIRAIQENNLVNFRKFYRNIDLLLIDDVHFLAGKERIQEEFFHTFNELYESQKQICLSSDRPASEISKLEARLVSRFQWGMLADIQAPDLETRVAILTKKAKNAGYDIPDDIITFMAQHITRNVRRMEGALTRVASINILTKKELNISTVESLIQDILLEEAQSKLTIEKIQKKIIDFYELRMTDLLGKRRPNKIAFPRQVAMYLCRLLTSHSLQEIGDAFGGRDHGTVIHACKTVENMTDQDDKIKRDVDYLTKNLSV